MSSSIPNEIPGMKSIDYVKNDENQVTGAKVRVEHEGRTYELIIKFTTPTTENQAMIGIAKGVNRYGMQVMIDLSGRQIEKNQAPEGKQREMFVNLKGKFRVISNSSSSGKPRQTAFQQAIREIAAKRGIAGSGERSLTDVEILKLRVASRLDMVDSLLKDKKISQARKIELENHRFGLNNRMELLNEDSSLNQSNMQWIEAILDRQISKSLVE